ncbi:MAG: outer membrane beta-barrel protein [Muribaculaceae bacterium]|nr:outer membrane beta-barrel protein [Muribaculaceae bacterium]
MKRLYTLSLIIAVMLSVQALQCSADDFASYKFDVGAHFGMSGYLGDANESNMFKHPGYTAGASFRYLPNSRWAFRGIFSTGSLSGNTADYEDVFPGGVNYEFSSQFYDLGGRCEFNFFNYGIGETYKKMRRWSPYLSVGIGATLATCDGSSAFALNIPMGIGVKYKIKQRLNLGVEFSMTKVFGDNVDGKQLTDLYQIKSSFLKNTDWYSQLSISITYEFGKRCETCHYVE